jgi:predicted phosphodiesterase
VNNASQSNAPYKVLVIHQPAYYTNVTDPSNAQLHELLPAYAEQAGIDIVFSGHDHSYARTEEINGVVYYICGTSGEKAYPVTQNEDFHFVIATDDFTATYLTLNATNEAITVTTYDFVDGVPTIIDTYTKSN